MATEQKIEWDEFSYRKSKRDLMLKVETKTFWVSRQELADSSPVFNSMLNGQFREAKQNLVQFPDKEAKDVLEILRCLFPTNQKTKDVDEKNVEILLKFADEYEIEYLTEKCSKFLTKFLKENGGAWMTEEKILKFLLLGIQYELKEFVRSSLHVLLRCDTKEVMRYEEELPPQVLDAIRLLPLERQIFAHKFEATEDEATFCHSCILGHLVTYASGYECKFCKLAVCRHCFNERDHRYKNRCNVARCRGCSKVFGETGIFCKCVDRLAMAILEKGGL